ncbi:MAG TPA: HopJ type III effector protein [Moraxellaceae bacterium]|nr:HopJ type III effector protein [Moraxellaceae bacterium]
MTLPELLERLRRSDADFEDAIAYVNAHYDYTPTRFTNGLGGDAVVNEAGKNEGSCRLFALARVAGLSASDTVHLFGRFYREDVLKHPDGSDHANIRRFLRDGWAGIRFDGEALRPRQ